MAQSGVNRASKSSEAPPEGLVPRSFNDIYHVDTNTTT